MSALDSRVDRGAVRTFVVADVLVVLTFVVVGELSHNINPLLHPDRFVGTATPFFVGWLLVGPLAGAYAARLLSSTRALVVYTVGPWILADVVAQLLRNTSFFPGEAVPSFFLVSAAFGSAFLLVGRFGALYLPRIAGRVVRRVRA